MFSQTLIGSVLPAHSLIAVASSTSVTWRYHNRRFASRQLEQSRPDVTIGLRSMSRVDSPRGINLHARLSIIGTAPSDLAKARAEKAAPVCDLRRDVLKWRLGGYSTPKRCDTRCDIRSRGRRPPGVVVEPQTHPSLRLPALPR